MFFSMVESNRKDKTKKCSFILSLALLYHRKMFYPLQNRPCQIRSFWVSYLKCFDKKLHIPAVKEIY